MSCYHMAFLLLLRATVMPGTNAFLIASRRFPQAAVAHSSLAITQYARCLSRRASDRQGKQDLTEVEQSPRQKRLSRTKEASRKAAAAPAFKAPVGPGKASAAAAKAEAVRVALDPQSASLDELLEAAAALEAVGASKRLQVECTDPAVVSRGLLKLEGGALLKAVVFGEIRLGRLNLAQESLAAHSLESFQDLASDPWAADTARAASLFKLLKTLCQNDLVDEAAKLADTYGLLGEPASSADAESAVDDDVNETSPAAAAAPQQRQQQLPWAEHVPLLHAALSRGYVKVGNWEKARAALRAWKLHSINNMRSQQASSSRGSTSPSSSTSGYGTNARLTVPTQVGNSLLRAAAKGRQLAVFLEALETLGTVGFPPDADTYEMVSQTSVQSIRFMMGAVSTETLPEAGPPEAAFVGRSNVGKSSLVNMVVGRRAMAYTSKTPGKTQQFNYFNVNGESTFDEPKGEFNLVDLPGVGYAKVPKRVRDEWAKFMTDYFYTRPTLKVIFHLIDSRHGPVAADEELMKLVADSPRPLTYVMVLTKADKKDSAAAEKSMGLKRSIEALRSKLATNGLNPSTTPIVLTSSVSRLGRDHMWRFLRLAADPEGFEP